MMMISIEKFTLFVRTVFLFARNTGIKYSRAVSLVSMIIILMSSTRTSPLSLFGAVDVGCCCCSADTNTAPLPLHRLLHWCSYFY
jgi:hypothetical protein